MRCAPSSWGRRTACSSGHDHAQPSRYSHHAQRRCTRRVRAQTGPCSMRAACVGASNAHVGAVASRPRGLLARQPAGVQPSTLHITARATEPSGSGAEAVSDEPETAAVEGLNPLFNDQFANVLRDSLNRQGTRSLFSGPIQSEPPPDVRRPSAQEEVLQAALQNSRRNLRALEASQKALADAVSREQKQFERLHFCLQKSVSDAAYLHTIEQLLEEKRGEISDFEADQLAQS